MTYNSTLYMSTGIAYEKLEKWDESIADYKFANEIFKKKSLFSKDDPICISNIANAETGKLQWEQALADFSYSSKLNPKYLAPVIGKALVQYQIGQKDESMASFQSLVLKYPDYSDGLAALAVMYYTHGDLESARTSWEDALEQDSRYLDVDWVRDIRRWPPQLVKDFIVFRQGIADV